MLTKLRSKLTYPYVASTLALFLALTGGAFALQGKNTVDSGDIKKNAVKSSDIRSPNGVKSGDVTDNGLTGTDIDESTFGQVPSAANAANATSAENADHANTADSANTASDAGRVGGLAATKISYSGAASTGAQTIFDGAGLRLAAACSAASEVDLDATTTKTDSNIFLTSVVATGTNTTFGFNQENQNFDAGSTIEVEDKLGGGDRENATIQYVAPDGAVATVEVALDDADAAPGCQVSGFGMAG